MGISAACINTSSVTPRRNTESREHSKAPNSPCEFRPGKSWDVLVLGQVCLCDPLDYSLPISSVPEVFRQEYMSGLPLPPPGDPPDPVFQLESPLSPVLQADCLPSEPLGKGKYAKSHLYSCVALKLYKIIAGESRSSGLLSQMG